MMKPWIERRAAEMREFHGAILRRSSNSRRLRLGRDERIPALEPLVSEIDLTQLQDKTFRVFLLNTKLRWSIAKQVRDIRLDKGWTQQELADKASISKQTINRIENPSGGCDFSVATLTAIANAFDCGFSCRFCAHGEFLRWIAYLEATATYSVPSFDEEFPPPERAEQRGEGE